jgi:hypothetical protein
MEQDVELLTWQASLMQLIDSYFAHHSHECADLSGVSVLFVVLEIVHAAELLSVNFKHNETMVFPRRFVFVMLQLHGKSKLKQGFYKGLNPVRVMIPPTSVHVRTVFECDDSGPFLSRVELVIDISSGIGAHGCVEISSSSLWFDFCFCLPENVSLVTALG